MSIADELGTYWHDVLMPEVAGMLFPQSHQTVISRLAAFLSRRGGDWRIRCDHSNNPDDLISRGGVAAEVKLVEGKSAYWFRFKYDPGSAEAACDARSPADRRPLSRRHAVRGAIVQALGLRRSGRSLRSPDVSRLIRTGKIASSACVK